MKFNINLSIEIDLNQDQKFDDFKVKVNGHEIKQDVKLPERKVMYVPAKDLNTEIVKKRYKPLANRDKKCEDCGDNFHDESRCKSRKWCNKCKLLHGKILHKSIMKQSTDPIEKTIAEIETNEWRREATPYEFVK